VGWGCKVGCGFRSKVAIAGVLEAKAGNAGVLEAKLLLLGFEAMVIFYEFLFMCQLQATRVVSHIYFPCKILR
jgi:hypothetical protein